MKVKPIFACVEDVNRKDYFNYYGITSIVDFIQGKVNEDDVDYISMIKDRKNKFKKLYKFLSKYYGRQAYVLVDPDLDGYCASAIVMRHKFGFDDIIPVFHSKKQHGVDDEIIEKIEDGSILIVPDASIEVDMIEKLDAKNIITAVIDHHPTLEGKNDTDNDNHCYICNDDVPQSGSMFVYQYVRALRDKDPINAELGVLGNFGDVQEQNFLETRSINFDVQNPKHNLICDMLKTFSEQDKLYSDAIGWKVGPKINAVIRSINQELKEKVFACLYKNESNEDIISACDGQHMWQKDHVKSIVNDLYIDDSHNVIIVETPEDKEIVGMNGLIANRIQSQKNKPVISVTYNEELGYYRGSLRSPVALKTILNELVDEDRYIVDAQGHESACGIRFKKEDKNLILDKLDEVDLGGDEIEVMLSCRPDELTTELFEKFSSNVACGVSGESVIPYWGKGIPSPTIHMTYRTRFEDIEFIGRYKDTVEFPIDADECRYSIFKDYIGRANKINLGICYEFGKPNRYGRCKLVNNSGPVDIEMLGILEKKRGKYTFVIKDWEFHPINIDDDDPCW